MTSPAGWPKEFPGAWQNLPLGIRKFLAARLVEKQLELQDGAAGVIEWLYRGTTRQPEEIGGLTTDLVNVVGEVRYKATADQLWPLVVRDTEAYLAAREAATKSARNS